MDNKPEKNIELLNPKSAYFVPNTAPLKKEYTPLSKKENIFIFITLAELFIFVDLAFFHGFSLGFTISFPIIFGFTTAFIYDKKAENKLFSFICGAFSLILSISTTFFNNTFIKPVSLLIILFLFAIYCLGISGGITRFAGSYKLLIDLFLETVGAPFGNLENVFGSIKAGAKKNKGALSVLIGCLCALPVLIVIIPLLVSSDAAFEGLVGTVFENIGEYLIEIAVAVVVLPFFYSYLLSRRRKNYKMKQTKKADQKKLSSTICISFLSVISLTYIVYLFYQLAYFFSAFKGILPEDYVYTASAFARRGFYEMFAICVINIALISLVSLLSERKNKKLPAFIKVLSTFISLFSVLLIIVAMQKMRLNISTYGLSVNRILVCAFMLMMLFVIAFFILHIFAPKVKYMQAIIIICAVIFTVLTFSDIDRIAAEYNISAYTSGELETLDVEAIANMSDSAVPSLVKLTESKDEKIAKKAKKEIAKRRFYRMDLVQNDSETALVYTNEGDFREYNRAKVIANNTVKDYFAKLSDKDKEEFINVYD
ncbi:MAG: DUF4173 domain-containing protein [Eubacterium sp.]|nr:DUF4173 domain-containing protein [Eubacterium sp.]